MFRVFMLNWMENLYSTPSLRGGDSSLAILLLAFPTFAVKEPCNNFWELKTCVLYYYLLLLKMNISNPQEKSSSRFFISAELLR